MTRPLTSEFTISGIQRAKRGEPKIEVTFEVDTNGILKVSALDTVTRSEANITITNRCGDSLYFVLASGPSPCCCCYCCFWWFLGAWWEYSARLSDEQVDRMLQEAQEMKAQDERHMKRVSAAGQKAGGGTLSLHFRFDSIVPCSVTPLTN